MDAGGLVSPQIVGQPILAADPLSSGSSRLKAGFQVCFTSAFRFETARHPETPPLSIGL
jgi:hypothetical protein